jgi:hypothetical protein
VVFYLNPLRQKREELTAGRPVFEPVQKSVSYPLGCSTDLAGWPLINCQESGNLKIETVVRNHTESRTRPASTPTKGAGWERPTPSEHDGRRLRRVGLALDVLVGVLPGVVGGMMTVPPGVLFVFVRAARSGLGGRRVLVRHTIIVFAVARGVVFC